MKNVKFNYLLTLILSLIFISCNTELEDSFVDEDNADAFLEILSSERSFNFASSDNLGKDLVFKSNKRWEIKTSEQTKGWVTFSLASGNSGNEIIVKVNVIDMKDDETEPRSGTFKLASDNLEEEFSVYQAEKSAIVISNPENYKNLSSEEQTIKVEFSTNVQDFEVETEFGEGVEPWIEKIDPSTYSRAMISHELNFKIKENTEIESRSAFINIKAKTSDATARIEVVQKGIPQRKITITNKNEFEKELSCSSLDIEIKYELELLNDDELKVEFKDDNQDIEWITDPHFNNGVLKINIAENKDITPRSAKIKISCINYENVLDEVEITQSGDNIINLTEGSSLESLINNKFGNSDNVTSLKIKGQLTDNDWTYLKDIAKKSSLVHIDLSEITNTKIPNSALMDSKIESLILPTNMEFIPMELCRNNGNLKSIVIPEGVRYIDRHAFAACEKLDEIWLPSTLEYIYGYAFEKTGITKIHIKSKPVQCRNVMRGTDTQSTHAEPFGSDSNNYNNLPWGATLYVPLELVNLYNNHNPTLEDFGWDTWMTYGAAWSNEITNYDFVWTNDGTKVITED